MMTQENEEMKGVPPSGREDAPVNDSSAQGDMKQRMAAPPPPPPGNEGNTIDLGP